MIADGRETALIPFMLRPFRCTDTRGRQAGPRQCGYACVRGHGGSFTTCTQMIPHHICGKNPPISLWLSECVCERERERIKMPALCIYLHPRSRGGLWGISLLAIVDLSLLMKFTFFESMCVSYFFRIYTNENSLKTLTFIFVWRRDISLNIRVPY